MNGASPIPPSRTDRERQRLENSLDNDLSSISLGMSNTASTSFGSHSSISTLPAARSAAVADYRPSLAFDDTPRPGGRNPSFATSFASAGVGLSPTSTDGHHVSAATLAGGVFNTRRPANPNKTADEFDPERSLGNLARQLKETIGDANINKPSSPFQRPLSPRSPTPPQHALPNLSFSLNRNDPLPSPPASRTVSAASSKSSGSGSGGRVLDYDAHAHQTRRADSAVHHHSRHPLAETGRHNLKDKSRSGNPYLQVNIVPNSKRTARDETLDITGMTGLLATPAKGMGFESIDKNAAPETAGANLATAISSLHARLSALQNENGVATQRIRDLEDEVQRAREEIVGLQRRADERVEKAMGGKEVLEQLVATLRLRVAQLQAKIEEQKLMIANLQASRDDVGLQTALAEIRREIERLSREVAKLNERADQSLLYAREQRSMRIDEEELERVTRDVSRREQRAAGTQTDALPSQLRQGLHAAGATEVGLMPPSAKAVRIVSSDSEGEGMLSPTPSSRRSASRMSRHASPPPQHQDAFFPARQPESNARRSPAAERAERDLRERKARKERERERTAASVAAAPAAVSARFGDMTEHTASGHRVDSVHPPADTTPSNHSVSSTRSRTRREQGPLSPFPSIRAEDELAFFSPHPSPAASPQTSLRDVLPAPGSRKSSGGSNGGTRQAQLPRSNTSRREPVRNDEPVPQWRTASGTSAASTGTTRRHASGTSTAGAPTVRAILDGADVPPATVLTRVINELEADFAHYKSVYVELADQYKVLDAASAVAKRHVLAAHLKEVIDCLEHKADQVAALYSIMSVEDRPASPAGGTRAVRSVQELWRGVRDVLGEDAVRRLEADGLFRQAH